MKVLAGLITQGTGSLGGMTMSKNKSGYYLRARTVPSNPRTSLQSAIRTGLAAFATLWKLLPRESMLSWALYAANSPIIGNNGQSHLLSGFNWFLGANQLRLQAGYGVLSDAPVIFGQASGPYGITASYTTDVVISVSFSMAGRPTEADSGDVTMIFIGKPAGLGVAYFQGPWQYVGTTDNHTNDVVTYDTSVLSSYTCPAGAQQWIKLVRIKPNGQYSTPVYFGPIAGYVAP